MNQSDQASPIHELEYARPMPKRSRWTQLVVACIALSVFVWTLLWFLSVFQPSGHARTRALVKCSSNLKQLGNAMLLYANDFGGRFPDSIGGLMEEDITPQVYVCPLSNDTPAALGPTTQATAANIESGGHCSYIYLGKGLTNTQTADFILAYEPLSNHKNAGMNVLYGDFHVEFLTLKEANWAMSELKAGRNPPRDPKKVKQPGG
jgi:prepilin-type processing-associated H-X9-DG protein